MLCLFEPPKQVGGYWIKYAIISDMAQRGALKNITFAKKGKIEWLMVRKNDVKTLKYLKEEFGFDDIDLSDVGPPIQSPKISYRNDYVFMVLQYPQFNSTNGAVYTAEIDFFIQKNRLITVDISGVTDLQLLFQSFLNNHNGNKTSEKHVADDINHLIYLLIHALIEGTYPLLRSMSTDIENIEDAMFEEYNKDFIRNLLRVKTNIVRSRQAMQGHDDIIQKLKLYFDNNFTSQKKLDVYFNQLSEDTRDITNRLLLKKETIDALHETHQSLTDFRTNEIIKTLTIVSFIVFPLTLMAGIFGMNAINMPFVEHPLGFWMILGIMLTGCVVMIGFFKYKKWI